MSTLASEASLKAISNRARIEAKLRQQLPSTAHVLIALLQRGEPTSTILARIGVREAALLPALKAVDGEPTYAIDRTFDRARKLARECGAPEVSDLMVLTALAEDSRSNAHRALSQMDADVAGLSAHLRAMLGYVTAAPEAPLPPAPVPRKPLPPARAPHRSEVALLAQRLDGRPSVVPRTSAAPPTRPEPSPTREDVPDAVHRVRAVARNVRSVPPPDVAPAGSDFGLDPSKFPLLTQLGRNLTELAEAGRIDDAPGRDREIERVLDVLGRRRSNNPILVGPPGVGKTALAEALAHRFVRERASGGELRRLVELTPGSLSAGTGVRGALAERMRKLRAEVQKADGSLVLFLDEIHTLVGSGGDGSDELANELKAALARGELPCIGATTEAEYTKHFERDAALCRRFSVVHVEEPARDAALAMLGRALPAYGDHHRVAYDEEAAEAAVDLTVRFLPDRRLPDKALAALDQAGARVRRRGASRVGRADVATVVAEWSGISLDRLTQRDGARLVELEQALAERVVGHAPEMARVADALRKGAAGFRGKRPLATLLFLGPTGVGKTETAKAIADVFFAGAPMTRLDFSEYSEAHAVAKLLGAPPGYVGHDAGGQLTEPVRRRPYQLVLLDEIEKAHPEVLLSLLPVLDEGRATDARGRTVDFTNTVIVLTSNLGVRETSAREKRIGFGAEREREAEPVDAVLEAARRALPPELWNRIDEPLHFKPLRREDVREIARRMLAGVGRALVREHGVTLGVAESAIDALLDAGGFDPSLGARPMRRVVGRLVEARLASLALEGRLAGCRTVELSGSERAIELRLVGDDVADVAE